MACIHAYILLGKQPGHWGLSCDLVSHLGTKRRQELGIIFNPHSKSPGNVYKLEKRKFLLLVGCSFLQMACSTNAPVKEKGSLSKMMFISQFGDILIIHPSWLAVT